MVHHIGAYGIVAIHRKRDLQFRSYAIDACYQNGLAHSGKVWREESSKTANLAQDFWPMGAFDARLYPALDEIT